MKDLKCIKNNFFILLFSALFSAMLVISKHFILNTDSCFDARMKDVTVYDFHWFDIVAVLAFTVVIFAFLSTAVEIVSRGLSRLAARRGTVSEGQSIPSADSEPPETASARPPKKRSAASFLFYLAIFAVLIISWLPYTMTFMPFGVFSDTNSVIRQATGEKVLTNHHPILYTFMWKVVYNIGALLGRDKIYLKIFSLLQEMACAAVYAYYIYRLRALKAGKRLIFLSVLFFAFVPLVPLYVASLWKDTLFCLALFAYTVWLAGVVRSHEEIYAGDRVPAGHIVSFAVSALLMIFLRNNGFYIFIASAVIILLFLVAKHGPRKVLPLTAAFVAIMAFTLVVTGPVYDHFNLNVDEKVESFGIPLQQCSYINVTDGKISAQDQAFLDKIIPKETLKEVYDPLAVDSTKWDEHFDLDFLNKNSSEFLRVYTRLVRDNPSKAVKAYMLATFGFWSTSKTTRNGYVSIRMFYKDKMKQTDYFERLFGFSISSLLSARNPIYYGALIWIALFMCAVLLQKRQYKYLIPFVPSLTGWATVMVATPCAFSLRYVYFLFLLLPVFVYLLIEGLQASEDGDTRPGP